MFDYIHRKGLEVKEAIAGAADYFLHRDQYKTMWIETARVCEDARARFEETYGKLDLLEHGLTHGFEPELDDSIDKRF